MSESSDIQMSVERVKIHMELLNMLRGIASVCVSFLIHCQV